MENDGFFTQEDIRALEVKKQSGTLDLFEECLLKDLTREPFKFNYSPPGRKR